MQTLVATHNPGNRVQVYLQAPETAWFACSNGLTKGTSSELFALEETPLLCILLYVIPEVFLYNAEEGT